MPFTQWKQEFSVGIERFDVDHRYLFSLLNQSHVSMASGESKSALDLILRELAWYAQTQSVGYVAGIAGTTHIAKRCGICPLLPIHRSLTYNEACTGMASVGGNVLGG
jgi:hypothetical protein